MKVGNFLAVLAVATFTTTMVLAEPGTQKDKLDDNPTVKKDGMDYIRSVAKKPDVKNALEKKGYSPKLVKYRLTMLDRSLSSSQERNLAMSLKEARNSEKTSNGRVSSGPGNHFLATTVNILTEIIMIPVTLISWIIPGL